MSVVIQDAVKQLLKIVGRLQDEYPKKRFTLDGRLVGDLGETLVESAYELEVFGSLEKHYDAKTPHGRRVQIKATMKNSLTFPVDHVPDYYLGIQIQPDGTFEEVFNGPGPITAKAVENRKPTKTNLHSVSIKALRRLNQEVPTTERIPERADRP